MPLANGRPWPFEEPRGERRVGARTGRGARRRQGPHVHVESDRAQESDTSERNPGQPATRGPKFVHEADTSEKPLGSGLTAQIVENASLANWHRSTSPDGTIL